MHARIQDFLSGWARKQSGQLFFLFVLSLFYSLQRGPMVLLQRKKYTKGGGVQNIPGGGPNDNFYRNRYKL